MDSKYEYKIVSSYNLLDEDELNELGALGWKLIDMGWRGPLSYYDYPKRVYYFIRKTTKKENQC